MQELKAIEILKRFLNEPYYSEWIPTDAETNEAIKELKEYEQNFKQKEFEYRTNCQNLVSAGRVEADNMPDRLAELEKVILDYYLAKGYELGSGDWSFKVEISTRYKSKLLIVFFTDKEGKKSILRFSRQTTKKMFDRAIEYFSTRQNEVMK